MYSLPTSKTDRCHRINRVRRVIFFLNSLLKTERALHPVDFVRRTQTLAPVALVVTTRSRRGRGTQRDGHRRREKETPPSKPIRADGPRRHASSARDLPRPTSADGPVRSRADRENGTTTSGLPRGERPPESRFSDPCATATARTRDDTLGRHSCEHTRRQQLIDGGGVGARARVSV